MALDTLQDFLLDEIKDLYSAEKQLVKALPKMAKAATSEELRQGFETHYEETKEQLERLERIFEYLDQKPKAKHCEAMDGLIEEGSEIIEEDGDPSVKDAALITAAQKVEHYEIASYGSAHAHAIMLGLDDVAELLEETLEEERLTDEKLTEIADTCINVAAMSSDTDEDTDDETDEDYNPKKPFTGSQDRKSAQARSSSRH